MAAVGQLAAGIAHEINNPVGFISSNLGSLNEYLEAIQQVLQKQAACIDKLSEEGCSVAEVIQELEALKKKVDLGFILSDIEQLMSDSIEGTQPIKGIVADLSDFSHVDEPELAREDINQLLEKTINVAWNELKYKADIKKEFGALPKIMCNGGKLAQAFLNLLVNAAQAIESKGVITIRTGRDDARVWVTIADTGSGIPEPILSKPWGNDELRFIVRKAIKSAMPEPEEVVNKGLEGGLSQVHGMLGSDRSMHLVFERISKAATANIPVFITGETGTGKELVARACHLESFRKSHPFIAVNCANFTENLMESQLFGHNKGAFTGATGKQEGLFATAGEGTLFLDEVTTIPLPLQAKLLRVIQEREYAPIGSHTVEPFYAQIVTASSTRLSDAVDKGEFREDLYYRLNVISIELPPLRQRGEDILLLADYFLEQLSAREGKNFNGFSDEARELLLAFRWPGNVRQLENLLHGIVVLNDGPEVTAEILSQSLQGELDRLAATKPTVTDKVITSATTSRALTDILPLWQVEKAAIEDAIAICDGNIPKTAALLDVSPSTIYRKQKNWA